MRYELKPGQPVKVIFEPWNLEVHVSALHLRGRGHARHPRLGPPPPAHPRAAHPRGPQRFTVHLLGSGMPSFYVADLGDLSFTLGLSGLDGQ